MLSDSDRVEEQNIETVVTNSTITSTTTTLPFEITWDNAYKICTHPSFLEIGWVGPSLLIGEDTDFTLQWFDFLMNDVNDEKITEFCNENFSHNPISPELYIYSAKWLDEIYSLRTWINLTNEMCTRHQEVCEGYGEKYNYDYDFLTLSAAFQIVNFEDKYNCFIDTTYPDKVPFNNNRYLRSTNRNPNENDLVGKLTKTIAQQYIRSSVIFPKPVKDIPYSEEDDFYLFSPEYRWNYSQSMTQEPPLLWWCIPAGNNNVDGPLLIEGYGPPIIRGNINADSPEIEAEGSWVMWSVIEPGPNSTVIEFEITKFFWFNEIPTTVEFCNDYEISNEYLEAKKDENSFYFALGGDSLINFEFVTSNHCERRLESDYKYP
tara:strand:+ start:203 stop:1330 length:1128 start_codon:yes stop_codon:yes gene_type:complete